MDESTQKPAPTETSTPGAPGGYEAPRVERALTQETLEQEVLYAGRPSVPEL
jgi:hypothetical protein